MCARALIAVILTLAVYGRCYALPIPRTESSEQLLRQYNEPSAKAKAKAKGVSPNIVAAWEKAGAHYQEGKPGAPPLAIGALPTFSFNTPICLVKGLPAPDAPFELRVEELPDGILRFDNLQSLVVHDLRHEADCWLVACLKNLRSLYCTILTDAGARQLKACRQLRALRFAGDSLTDVGVAELSTLEELEELQLGAGTGSSKITDRGIKHLANIRDLKKIELWGRATDDDTILVTDEGLKSLAGLVNLEEVTLGGYRAVTDVGVRSLGSLPCLQSLTVWQLEVTGEGVAGLKGLKSLSLKLCPLSDAGLKSIGGLRLLEFLMLWSQGETTEAGVNELAVLGKLRELGLMQIAISDANLKQFSALRDLRSLALDFGGKGSTITEEGLQALQGLKNLRTLFLPETVTDRALNALAGMKLKDLYIPESAKTELGFKHYLAACDVGTKLNLFSWHLTDASLREIKDQKQLTVLLVAGCGITDAGLSYLAGLTGLEELCLSETGITDAGLKTLAGFPKLRTLEIQNASKIKGPGLKELGQLPQLRSLDLSGTPIGKEGAKHVSGLKRLEHLKLSGTRLTDEALSALGALEQVKSLDLSDTEITDAGLKVFRLFPRVEELNLGGTKVTDQGIQTLAEIRHLQDGLTCLKLGDSKITDAGLVHIPAFKELVTLDLQHTRLTVEGLKGLAGMKTLRCLWIDTRSLDPGNNVGEAIHPKEKLKKALPTCWISP